MQKKNTKRNVTTKTPKRAAPRMGGTSVKLQIAVTPAIAKKFRSIATARNVTLGIALGELLNGV